MAHTPAARPAVPRFTRHFFDGPETFTGIGGGAIGGKAGGLLAIRNILAERIEPRAFPAFAVRVPRLSVIGTDVFDAFVQRNNLRERIQASEADDRLALAFQQAALPAEALGDLRALVEQAHAPLAVRSSSMLEDALLHPFAGVYATKMTPNNQPDADTRFRKLLEAVKLVYASTFFEGARSYMSAMGHPPDAERMAVIIQEVVGCRHGDRYYPDVSGVARSFNFYRSGSARSEDGVVNLALGLGKTIVDGGVCWTYSPRYPRATPPFASVRELLKQTQVEFWAVNMGRPPAYDPTAEAEHLIKSGLAEADYDGTLRLLASTYAAESDRLVTGVGVAGPRVLNFAPLLVLEDYPLNDLLRRLLAVCEEELGQAVEIEFALTFPRGAEPPVQFGFLQVRPMVVSSEIVEVDLACPSDPVVLAASDRVMGNGVVSDIRDIVYVKPETFEARFTPDIADELAVLNRTLVAAHRPYLLIGFGRWGSSDPWLGIPVAWGHIGGARAIIEATLPAMDVELSQGSHFFHNISSFSVSYFCVPHSSAFRIDWEGLGRQELVAETHYVRHVRSRAPLEIRVDGRSGAGAILWGNERGKASMETRHDAVDRIIESLQERAKELNCLYNVHELMNRPDATIDEVCRALLEIIPPGYQYSGVCWVKITVDTAVYQPGRAQLTPWVQRAPIVVQGANIGLIEVFYTSQMPTADEGPFLKEERRLIDTIAERLGHFLMQRRLQNTLTNWRSAVANLSTHEKREWWVIIEFLRKTDQQLLMRISRRMINQLCWNGVEEAQQLLQRFASDLRTADDGAADENQPLQRRSIGNLLTVTQDAFRIAAEHLSESEIVSSIQKWIKDDKSSFLIEAVENHCTSLTDITHALERYSQIAVTDDELSRSVQIGLRVSLVRRFFTEDLDFINTAKNYIEVSDFHDLVHHIISPTASHGKLGGKSSGLFLAGQILRRSPEYADALGGVKVPKTWYFASDGLVGFVEYNHLEDVYNRKYLETDQIRREYPHIVQVFKNSRLTPEIMTGLSMALDDFEERPLIVRSSSLLEDRMGSAFSGKYKSLFLANQGTKTQRLVALADAITEVYASLFGPDPIEYRAERGLLDLNEEMGIMIQEVVGTRVGRYFLPAYAGVAFSNNEFRWSARIKREDGLVRLVPGLGTRAVDRVGDDYPILVAPGQPGLRVNVTPDEVARYSPRKVDLINLETERFETVDAADLFAEYGGEFPGLAQIASVQDEDGTYSPVGYDWNPDRQRLVVTFEGLVSRTPFMPQMRALLRLLAEKMGVPVDIEFASDGKDLYLLQCRPQSFSQDATPAPIPRDVPPDRVVFSTDRYVSNGRIPDVTHVVFVDPDAYAEIGSLSELRDVGRAVGRLNKMLPKRQFILMGPGRWGSRGDVKLGVAVTYSDIKNTSLLVEIAARRGSYVPDVSFGTHFFQDLVESSIRYLPLFPGEPGTVLNELFLRSAPNLLADMLPEFSHLTDVVRVIDVPSASDGMILRVVLNGDLDQAVGILATPAAPEGTTAEKRRDVEPVYEDHWRWRLRMAEHIAAGIDATRFGVAALYVFGSTKNATAGPKSDIDVLIHFRGSAEVRRDLEHWLEGWSLCLSEMNFLRTGYRTEGLLDVHIVTDEDFANQNSFAMKVGAITDAARPLPLRSAH